MINYISIVRNFFYSAAFLTGCCFVCGCENDVKQIDELTRNVASVDEGRNITSYLSQDGMMRAKLTAPLMIRVTSLDTSYVEFPKALHVDFFDDSTRIESWLDSKYGKYFEKQDKVYLRDSVTVINVRGDTLKCIELWWDQNARLFYSDTIAEYRTKDKHIFGGKGLIATQDMTSVTFKEPIGNVAVSDSGLAK